ncbi:MAG: EamA family transporter RarD [Gemmataceae bacterium]
MTAPSHAAPPPTSPHAPHPAAARLREGLVYGLVAYGWWGLVPLYFRLLIGRVGSFDILAHRILWSMVFLALVLRVTGRWVKVRKVLRLRPVVLVLAVTTVLIAVNWLCYILAVEWRQVVQASLGYFITPLVSVVLGMVFLKERLRRLQGLALVLAATGVLGLALLVGDWPWIALALAFSFSFYGLLRKRLPIDGLVGLSVETMFLVPPALLFFAISWLITPADAWEFDLGFALLLACSGVITAVPLLCFGQAAQRLPLSTLGFLQYISPTVQFFLAVLVFHEDFTLEQLYCFLFIWSGLVLFTIDSYRLYRRVTPPPR